MPFRTLTIAGIAAFFFAVLAGTFVYGPARRTFAEPGSSVMLRTAREIDGLWRSSGVRGRLAVVFSRHLVARPGGLAFPEADYLVQNMKQGIVRSAFLVVPDRSWSAVISNILLEWPLIVPLMSTDSGYVLLHEGGRINIMPLSKYLPGGEREKALVVIEQEAWSPPELSRIEGFIRSGQLPADLTIVIGRETGPEQRPWTPSLSSHSAGPS